MKPTTVVTAITPSAETWPENLLRFYIHFSAPMSRRGAIGFVSLVDDKGQTLSDVFLEVNANLWNDDDTRFTVLFDPGRVKRGILPNSSSGVPSEIAGAIRSSSTRPGATRAASR